MSKPNIGIHLVAVIPTAALSIMHSAVYEPVAILTPGLFDTEDLLSNQILRMTQTRQVIQECLRHGQ